MTRSLTMQGGRGPSTQRSTTVKPQRYTHAPPAHPVTVQRPRGRGSAGASTEGWAGIKHHKMHNTRTSICGRRLGCREQQPARGSPVEAPTSATGQVSWAAVNTIHHPPPKRHLNNQAPNTLQGRGCCKRELTHPNVPDPPMAPAPATNSITERDHDKLTHKSPTNTSTTCFDSPW
jgi:hypothetical protein